MACLPFAGQGVTARKNLFVVAEGAVMTVGPAYVKFVRSVQLPVANEGEARMRYGRPTLASRNVQLNPLAGE